MQSVVVNLIKLNCRDIRLFTLIYSYTDWIYSQMNPLQVNVIIRV